MHRLKDSFFHLQFFPCFSPLFEHFVLIKVKNFSPFIEWALFLVFEKMLRGSVYAIYVLFNYTQSLLLQKPCNSRNYQWFTPSTNTTFRLHVDFSFPVYSRIFTVKKERASYEKERFLHFYALCTMRYAVRYNVAICMRS